jgi:hypothetical protein
MGVLVGVLHEGFPVPVGWASDHSTSRNGVEWELCPGLS